MQQLQQVHNTHQLSHPTQTVSFFYSKSQTGNLRSYLQKVIQMFEHSDANLVQVFEETVENGHQISCCQLVPQDDCQLVYREG